MIGLMHSTHNQFKEPDLKSQKQNLTIISKQQKKILQSFNPINPSKDNG